MPSIVELIPGGIIKQNYDFHRSSFDGPSLLYPDLLIDEEIKSTQSASLAQVLLPRYSFGLASLLMTGPFPSTLLSINNGAKLLVGKETWREFQSNRRGFMKGNNVNTVRDFGLTLNGEMVVPQCEDLYTGSFFKKQESFNVVHRQVGSIEEINVGKGNTYFVKRDGTIPGGNLLAAGLAYGSLIKSAGKNGIDLDTLEKIHGHEISSSAPIRAALLFQLSKMVNQGHLNFYQNDIKEIIYEADETLDLDRSKIDKAKTFLTNNGILTKDGNEISINPTIGLIYEPYLRAIDKYNSLIGTQKGQEEMKSIFEFPFNHRQGFNIRHEIVQKTLKHEFLKPAKPKQAE